MTNTSTAYQFENPPTFELTQDKVFIKRCLTEPSNWRLGSDDLLLGQNPDLYFPPLENVIYLRASDYGLLIGIPTSYVCIDIHIALLPISRGLAVGICKQAIEWIFNHSDRPLRLNASIPETNRLAIKLARLSGMEFIGINRKSFMKNNVLYDQHLFGISKE